MDRVMTAGTVASYAFAMVLVAIGIGNLIYVHPVPGIAFLLFAMVYVPPVSPWLEEKLGTRTASIAKFIFGFALLWFTLGISDLGEIMGF